MSLEKIENNKIKIIALGGLGVDIIKKFDFDNIHGIDTLVLDTDLHALDNVRISNVMALGLEYAMGLSLNGNVKLGEAIMEHSSDNLNEFLKGADFAIAIVGLGGGFGTGAIQEVVNSIRKFSENTMVIYTIPFSFEGNRRNSISQSVIDNLKKSNLNVLVEVDSDFFVEHSYDRKDLKQTMKNIDNVILELLYNIIYILEGESSTDYTKISETLEKFPGITFKINSIVEKKKALIEALDNLKTVNRLEDIIDVDYESVDLNDTSIPSVLRHRKLFQEY